MSFIADCMLGKLARWLRMLGYDVKYFRSISDKQLIKTATTERRILLTCDLALYQQAKRQGINIILVDGATRAEKLSNWAKKSGLTLDLEITDSRCPKCNTKISYIPKKDLVGRVPLGTFSSYTEFWECPNCNQVYWHGSHWNRIQKTLKNARQMLNQ